MPINDFRDMFTDTVTITIGSAFNSYGRQTAGVATEYNCRYTQKNTTVKVEDGQEIVSTGVLWVESTASVFPGYQDSATLSDGTIKKVLKTELLQDDKGLHHIKIFLG